MSEPQGIPVVKQNIDMRTLVIGVGETGCMTIERMSSGESSMPGNPVIAVDDDPQKQGRAFAGVAVEGTCEDIPRLVNEFGISQIVSHHQLKE